MGKHINYYSNQSANDNDSRPLPNVSYIVNEDKVKYNKYNREGIIDAISKYIKNNADVITHGHYTLVLDIIDPEVGSLYNLITLTERSGSIYNIRFLGSSLSVNSSDDTRLSSNVFFLPNYKPESIQYYSDLRTTNSDIVVTYANNTQSGYTIYLVEFSGESKVIPVVVDYNQGTQTMIQ